MAEIQNFFCIFAQNKHLLKDGKLTSIFEGGG